MGRKRKKTWEEKVILVLGSFNRCKVTANFTRDFYENLFFLKPEIEKHFEKTDFEHQEKALLAGVGYILDFLDHSNVNAKNQVSRLAKSHSRKNLNIHPHEYYYWIEALIMTAKTHDPSWHDSLAYYWREVIFYPVSFMISQYFVEPA